MYWHVVQCIFTPVVLTLMAAKFLDMAITKLWVLKNHVPFLTKWMDESFLQTVRADTTPMIKWGCAKPHSGHDQDDKEARICPGRAHFHVVPGIPPLTHWGDTYCRPASAFLFRYPSVMIIGAVAGYLHRGTVLSVLVCAALLFGIVWEIAQIGLYHYLLGEITYELPSSARAVSIDSVKDRPTMIGYTHLKNLRSFISIIVVNYAVIVLTYTSIYAQVPLCDANGSHVPRPWIGCLLQHDNYEPVLFQAAYFSTVTLATVGYGDLAPMGVVPRAITMSEIAAGFGMLVLLFSTFTATLSAESP